MATQFYDAFFKGLEDSTSLSSMNAMKIYLLDSSNSYSVSASKDPGYSAQAVPMSNGEIEIVGLDSGATQSQVTLKSVSDDFDHVEVRFDYTGSYSQAFRAQLSQTYQPNGNNVNINDLAVQFNQTDGSGGGTGATEDGVAYILGETKDLDAATAPFKVALIEDRGGNNNILTGEETSDVEFQRDGTSVQELHLADSDVTVTNAANGSGTFDPVDGARIIYNSSTNGDVVLSDGPLGGNSFQWPENSDIIIGDIIISFSLS